MANFLNFYICACYLIHLLDIKIPLLYWNRTYITLYVGKIVYYKPINYKLSSYLQWWLSDNEWSHVMGTCRKY